MTAQGGWPRWQRADAPGSLVHYVHPDLVARLAAAGVLPGRSEESRLDRLRRLYDGFASLGLPYLPEPDSSQPGLQTIRPPDQVLVRPRGGTCLDLAVTAAGAALHAGLHPIIVVLDQAGQASHALLVVWLDGDCTGTADRAYPLHQTVWNSPPPQVLGDLRTADDQPGAFVALDITLATHRPDPTDSTPSAT